MEQGTDGDRSSARSVQQRALLQIVEIAANGRRRRLKGSAELFDADLARFL